MSVEGNQLQPCERQPVGTITLHPVLCLFSPTAEPGPAEATVTRRFSVERITDTFIRDVSKEEGTGSKNS